MSAHRTTRVWAFVSLVTAACSGSSAGPTVTADQAAGDAARALCEKFNACSPFFVQLEYGSLDACSAALKSSLASALAASGTGATAPQTEACATAVASASCDAAISHDLPRECQPVPGERASGAACGDSSQCKTAYCHKGAQSICGACADPPPALATCSSDADCATGSICSKAGACAVPGAAGASCDPVQQPCKATLACKDHTCATPDGAGAPCTKTTGANSTDTCDSLAGLYCNAQQVCASVNLVAAGQPCLLVDGALAVCSGNGTCNLPSKLVTSGACLAAAAPGATCTAKGPGLSYSVASADCALPATCQGGVCTVPDPGSCR